MRKYRDPRERNAWFDPSRAGRFSLPRWRLLFEYGRAILSARASTTDRLRSVACLPHWVATHSMDLVRDLAGWAAHGRPEVSAR
jgi:hypothetical protein